MNLNHLADALSRGIMISVARAILVAALIVTTSATADHSIAAADRPISMVDCLVLDTDANLDDLRALAVITTSRRVAAVIATAGILPAAEGASTLARLLSAGGVQGEPVVIQGRERSPTTPSPPPWNWLADTRKDARRLEGWLALAIPASPLRISIPSGVNGLAEVVEQAVRDCPTLGLVMIGPWTSAVAYLDRIADRIRFVLAQGRSPDDPADPDWDRVNCRFDIVSCRMALNTLQHQTFAWIDFTREGPTYPLDAHLVGRFAGRPIARALRTIMEADEQWKIQQLWDDATAVFLLRPDVFKRVGQHYEPAIAPEEMREVLGGIVEGSETPANDK